MSTISIIGSGGINTEIEDLFIRVGHTVEVTSRNAAKTQAEQIATKFSIDISLLG